jgi:hypothetical protein
MRRTFKLFASSITNAVRHSSSVSKGPKTITCLPMASNSGPPVDSVEPNEPRVQFSPVDYFAQSNPQLNNRPTTFSVNPGNLPRNRTQNAGRQSLHPAPTGGLSGAQPRRPSSIHTVGGTLKRRITKSETIRAYHVPTGSNWEPGAEPGIDTKKDKGEHHGLHQVSYAAFL